MVKALVVVVVGTSMSTFVRRNNLVDMAVRAARSHFPRSAPQVHPGFRFYGL